MALFTHSLHGSKRAYSIKSVDDPFNRDNYPWQYPIWEANTDNNQKQPSITSFIFHILNGFKNWPWKKCKLTLLIEIKLTQIILSFFMIYKSYISILFVLLNNNILMFNLNIKSYSSIQFFIKAFWNVLKYLLITSYSWCFNLS